jgi:hypothetical protein
MLVSPFAYYRGAALPMAADLAGMRSSGLRVQLCGDAHLSNFGAFASPERRLVFDLNDFDETLPGPFEWDVKRLVASMAVAGRDTGLGTKKRRRVALATAAAYRTAMREFAAMSILDVWYARFDVEDALARLKSDMPKKAVRRAKTQMAKARTRDSTQALAKLTTVKDGRREIISDPPLIVPIEELAGHLDVDAVYRFLRRPGHRVHADPAGLSAPAGRAIHPGPRGPQGRRRRQRRHRDVDLADGTRRRPRAAAPAGQAGPALGAGRLRRPERIPQPGRTCRHRPASDASRQRHLPRLATGPPSRPRFAGYYYLRQLRDWKYSADTEGMNAAAMTGYGRLCGWTLARAHARTGDRIAIAAYLGGSDKFDQAVADFGETYADQNERDHAALANAVASGRVQAQTGI